MRYEDVLSRMEELADPSQLAGQARYGIEISRSLGITAPELRRIAKEAGRDHDLALRLWSSGTREARILAALVADPARVTSEQMELWAKDFDSWDVVDACCCNLFDRTSLAWPKALEWASRPEEFVKRAGFVLMACLAVHDKKASNYWFEPFFEAIEREACDERNFVRKAVNWALRQIGKRNFALRDRAIEVASHVQARGCSPARWIASDALRELRSSQLEARLTARGNR